MYWRAAASPGYPTQLASWRVTWVPLASQNPTEPAPAEDAGDRDGNEDGDGAGRGKKRSASSRPENERVAAVQEKNRKVRHCPRHLHAATKRCRICRLHYLCAVVLDIADLWLLN